ncbi:hypothetical protein B4Q13_18850 [Lacticaseibacillus rhamnosus]
MAGHPPDGPRAMDARTATDRVAGGEIESTYAWLRLDHPQKDENHQTADRKLPKPVSADEEPGCGYPVEEQERLWVPNLKQREFGGEYN